MSGFPCCCPGPCYGCNCLRVAISGVGNDTCADCNLLNTAADVPFTENILFSFPSACVPSVPIKSCRGVSSLDLTGGIFCGGGLSTSFSRNLHVFREGASWRVLAVLNLSLNGGIAQQRSYMRVIPAVDTKCDQIITQLTNAHLCFSNDNVSLCDFSAIQIDIGACIGGFALAAASPQVEYRRGKPVVPLGCKGCQGIV